MGEKFYLTEAFKALNDLWQQKLKDSGFKEMEDLKSGHLFISESHYFFRHYSPEEFLETETYYENARDFYWNYSQFKNNLHKKIWGFHADGFPRRKISQTLKQEGTKISASSVQIIVSSLKKIMHSGLWTRRERDDEPKTLHHPKLSRRRP